jgi:hypothetical protein
VARSYRRDANGRFAGGGYSGQTGGRGARLKAKSTRAGGGAKVSAAKRSTSSGAIRKTDVIRARVSNGISKNIERRNKAGLNPPTAAKENRAARVKRAAGRIAARGGASKARKPKTADQLLTQATRIQIASNRLSRRARTGVQSRRVEERGAKAAAAAKARAFEMNKPKPLSKTAQARQGRAARVQAREQADSMRNQIMAARSRRR